GLLLQHSRERREIVPALRREFVLLSRRGRPHPSLEFAREPGSIAGHEGHEVVDDLAMLVDAHPSDARRGAFADVAEQARTSGSLSPLEDARTARPHRKDP